MDRSFPKELVRAYENLITNAIRYGRSGGKVEIGFSKKGNEAVVRISNFGEMIAESDIPYIFERFYRAEKSRSQHTGGSGLGLAISKSIIERHNGVIYVESSPLERISLPISHSSENLKKTLGGFLRFGRYPC